MHNISIRDEYAASILEVFQRRKANLDAKGTEVPGDPSFI
jgi:hypothetical protein